MDIAPERGKDLEDTVIEGTTTICPPNFLGEASVLDEQDTLTVAGRRWIMCDQHDGRGRVFVEFTQSLQEFAGRTGIESTGRLICQDHTWAADNGTSCSRPLAFAPGNFVRVLLQQGVNAERSSSQIDAPVDIAGRNM